MLSLCHACGEWFLSASEVFVAYTCPDCLEKLHSKDPFKCDQCHIYGRTTSEERKAVPF